jgi:glutamine amidotransferase
VEPEVHVVDYGMGNLRSVVNAFSELDCAVRVVCEPDELRAASHIVLPGVGAFLDGMSRLRSGGWVDILDELVLGERRPVLGLCLGMQMLLSHGTEHAPTAGLGWIPGQVVRMEEGERAELRVPHVGWNGVRPEGQCALFDGLGDEPDFYFVHSYACVPDDPSHAAGTTTHAALFTAAVHSGNVHGVQFHPEKSHKAGLGLLANFLRTDAATQC